MSRYSKNIVFDTKAFLLCPPVVHVLSVVASTDFHRWNFSFIKWERWTENDESWTVNGRKESVRVKNDIFTVMLTMQTCGKNFKPKSNDLLLPYFKIKANKNWNLTLLKKDKLILNSSLKPFKFSTTKKKLEKLMQRWIFYF